MIAGTWSYCMAGGGAPGHDGHLHVQPGRPPQVILHLVVIDDVYLSLDIGWYRGSPMCQ